jgi:hypothetical protein
VHVRMRIRSNINSPITSSSNDIAAVGVVPLIAHSNNSTSSSSGGGGGGALRLLAVGLNIDMDLVVAAAESQNVAHLTNSLVRVLVGASSGIGSRSGGARVSVSESFLFCSGTHRHRR